MHRCGRYSGTRPSGCASRLERDVVSARIRDASSMITGLLLILLGSLPLALGQTWAIGGRFRAARYLCVWAVATVLVGLFQLRFWGLRADDLIMRESPLPITLAAVAAALPAAALYAGSI